MNEHTSTGRNTFRLGARHVAASLLLMGATTALATAQTEMPVTTLHASDGGSGDNFGNAIAVSGDVILVGAKANNDFGSDSGSAYVCRYDGSGWSEEIKLLPADGAAGDEFGNAVAVDGDLAVIGARKDDDLGSSSGSAYVFRFQGGAWVQEAKLHAPDGASSDKFGTSVAINGNTIAVGASGDDDLGSSSGALYVFNHDGTQWQYAQKLLASDGLAGDFLGKALVMTDDLIVGGAYGHDMMGSNAGAAYVFRRNGTTWTQDGKLMASDGVDGAFLGWSVGAFENTIVVGAPQDIGNGPSSGAAYVYEFDGANWNQAIKLQASNGSGFDQFGRSVAVDGSKLLVGAHLTDMTYPDTGSAYMFENQSGTWMEETMMVSPTAYYWDQFGYSVALNGGRAVVGAVEDDDLGNNAGTAFAFTYDGDAGSEVCIGDLDADQMVGFSDLLQVIADWGACGACSSDIDGDGLVGFGDVFILIETWGNCA